MSHFPEILWQDEHFVAVMKPAGAVVHRSAEHRDAKVIMLQAVRDAIGAQVNAVHRLDRPTSGVLIFARTTEATAAMQEALTNGQKRYLAMVRRETPESGVIDRGLTHLDSDVVQPAVTEYRRVGVYDLGGGFGAASLVEALPHSGRRHQIRRHFAGIAHHLLLDTHYGKGGINRASLQAFIATLEIPEAEKQRLLQLSPGTYTGKAAELAKRI